MTKQITSNRLKIDEHGYAYVEDQDGEKYYSFDWKCNPHKKTRVHFKISKSFVSICLLFAGMWGFIIYWLIK